MAVSASNRSGQPPRVLIIDDDPFSRSVTSLKIASVGAVVVEAESGAKGLTHLLNSSFDAIILDLEMPGVDGYHLLGCIRGHPNLRHLPVIILSGRDDVESIQKALKAGATSYLLKPLNWSAFADHILSVLGLRGPAAAKRSLA